MTGQGDESVMRLDGGLVVSVQARDGSPLAATPMIQAMAAAVSAAKPVAFRLNGPDHIRAVREVTSAPIIGLHKVHNGQRNIITPTLELAFGLAAAGADIIAVDATVESRRDDFSIIEQVHRQTGLPVMADVSTESEGLQAWKAGAALVGTTLSGYTPQSGFNGGDPDLPLVRALTDRGVRVVAEGRYRTPAQVAQAFRQGAIAVVVGSAITDPAWIAASLMAATPRGQSQ